MKITKEQLKHIIAEELETVLSETESDDMIWRGLVKSFNRIRVPDPERTEGERALNISARMQSGPGVPEPYVYITSGGGYGTQASRHVVARFMTPESFEKVIKMLDQAYIKAEEEVGVGAGSVFADEVAEQYEKMVKSSSDSVERPGQDVPQPK